ncbi:MAG TPA: hypothetical protein VKA84_22965 [Gemmatimonadaceae bacterium]|nr:hypothetical protein [Gemmatimonadaceae bacterium]
MEGQSRTTEHPPRPRPCVEPAAPTLPPKEPPHQEADAVKGGGGGVPGLPRE